MVICSSCDLIKKSASHIIYTMRAEGGIVFKNYKDSADSNFFNLKCGEVRFSVRALWSGAIYICNSRREKGEEGGHMPHAW